MSKARQVVITGASIASPAGFSLAENYAAWRERRPNFVEITRFNTAGSSVRYAGECPEPDVKKLPDRKVQKILRRKDIISLLTTLGCAEAAGIKKGEVDPERFGMYVGASCTQIGDLTPYFTLVAECAEMTNGRFDSERFGRDLMTLVNPLVVLQTLMNNGLCFGTMTLDIRGVNANYMDFQVAGLRAVGEAFRSIATDRADVVIAGGIAGPVEPFQLAEGIRSGYLARTSELSVAPEDVVRPYDVARHGAVLSEGSAYVMLEEEGHALRRGATILGRVDGFSLANDGTLDPVSVCPSRGLVRSLAGALSEAGMGRGDLGFTVGHGNGSLYADAAEARSYLEFAGDGALPITSPKAVLGDMAEAGGVVGLILALETFQKNEVPPTFNFKTGDEYSSRLAIRDEPQACRHRRAVVTSRNFLGLCGAVVVSEA
jgi:3-oxoacyl-[acyl-carrier-protein] synthase II